jgi:hypothetical protein
MDRLEDRLILLVLAQNDDVSTLREVGCRNDLFFQLLGFLRLSVAELLVTFRNVRPS